MTVRNRFLNTALLLCHLLFCHLLVTSQLRPAEPLATEEVTIAADQQEKIGDVYQLRGNVHITFREYDIRADEITYNAASGDVTASGHLVFDGGPNDLHIQATRATYNSKKDLGKFYDVVGTTGAKLSGRHLLLTSSNPFAFSGKLVEKVGRDRIIVSHGTVTSCTLEDAKWSFNARRIDVVIGEDAKLYHSSFRLAHIPILYFPYASLPVEKLGRQSGFLIPSIGQSSRKGTIFGESVYWAINRSMDATLGAEYWSHRGWAQHGQFRARPSASSNVLFTYFGVLDRGYGFPKQTQGGQDIALVSEAKMPFGLRGVADLNYLSSYVFRLAFSESFTQAVNSEVKSNAFLSKSYNGHFFGLMGSRYQNFQSTNRGDLITILRVPGLDVASVDRKLGSSPIYFSYDASLTGVSRREPDFVTDPLVGRFDLYPRAAVPFHLAGWDFRPEIALRDTYYTQRRIPNGGVGEPGPSDINRRAFETSVEIRPPALTKVFANDILDHKVKHAIEPRLLYHYVNGVENFNRIIRFDSRDILADTNELEFAVTNRIYAKSNRAETCGQSGEIFQSEDRGMQAEITATNCGTGAREIFTWDLAAKYYFDRTFGGALVLGQRNVFTTTEELTGLGFLTEYRRFSPVVSRMRIHTARDTEIEWHFDYDPVRARLNASTALVNHHIGNYFVAGSHAFLQAPGEVNVSTSTPSPTQFNQFRILTGYANPNKRGISAATNIGFDVTSRFLQYTAFQASYNWDCCGFSVEYRRLALGPVRNENQFRFALNLSNIGTFGTLRRQERLF